MQTISHLRKNDTDTMNDIQNQFQTIVQNIRVLEEQQYELNQKLREITTAKEEVSKSDSTYKILGSILIEKKPSELQLELEDEENHILLRIKTLTEQQNTLTKQKVIIEGKLKGEEK